MKPELKELLLEIKSKINDDKFFRNFVGDVINEANYNRYYEQPVADQEIAEQLVEIYFIEKDIIGKNSIEDIKELEGKIMKIFSFLEEQKELIKEYIHFVESRVSQFMTELN